MGFIKSNIVKIIERDIAIDRDSYRFFIIDTAVRVILIGGLFVISFIVLSSTHANNNQVDTVKQKAATSPNVVHYAQVKPSTTSSGGGSSGSSVLSSIIPMVVQTPQSNASKPLGLALGNTLPSLSSAQLNSELNGIASLGVNWIRIDIPWPDIQPQNATSYDWSTMDNIVAAATARHIKILAILDYAPAWARASGCNAESCAPASDSQFATFASAVVSRYAPDGLQSWEIWNEPNLEGSWQPSPSAQDYTNLLQATYTAIKKVEPSSTVISGGLGPLDGESGSIDQLTFLGQMYADGAKPYFDAVGYHPYSYPATPSYVTSWNSWSTLSDLPTSVRSIMNANGDAGKHVWVTEFGAPTGGPGAIATTTNSNFTAGPDHVDDALQSEILSQALSDDQSSSWMGGFFWYSYQDLGTDTSSNENFFGLLTYSGSEKPVYSVMQSATSNLDL